MYLEGSLLADSFFIAGKMLFAIGLPMIGASIVGNYLGSHMTIKKR